MAVAATATMSLFARTMFTVVLPLTALANMGAEGGCAGAQDSDDVAQDKIVKQIWLYHNAKTNKTDVRATFRFGNDTGTVLQLKEPARATFDGKELGFDPNWGWHHIEVSGVADNGTLIHVDNDGVETALATGDMPRIAFPQALAEIARDVNTTLTWVGPPLQEGEDVEVFVASTTNRLNFVRFTAVEAGETSVTLTPNRLAQLPPGQALVALKRHKNTRPDARTKLTLSLESEDRAVELR